MFEATATIIGLSWLLNFAKVGWHKDQSNLALIIVHIICACLLAAIFDSEMALYAFLVCAGHMATIDAKRNGFWYGKLLSWCSSWPWELLALGMLAWVYHWIALPAGLAMLAGNMYIWTKMSPDHWNETKSERIWHAIRNFGRRSRS